MVVIRHSTTKKKHTLKTFKKEVVIYNLSE